MSNDDEIVLKFGKNEIKYNLNDPRLYSQPCKYWRAGKCKMGEKCRFLHGENFSDDPRRPEYNGPPVRFCEKLGRYVEIYSIKDPEEGEKQTDPAPSDDIGLDYSSAKETNIDIHLTSRLYSSKQNYSKYGRRPFVNIFMVSEPPAPGQEFRYDLEMIQYVSDVKDELLDRGIDVNIKISMNSQPIINGTQIYSCVWESFADYVILVFKENLRKGNVRVLSKGNIVEMDIKKIIEIIWVEWDQIQVLIEEKIGFKIPVGLQEKLKVGIDPDSTPFGLSEKELFFLYERHIGIDNFKTKIENIAAWRTLIVTKSGSAKTDVFNAFVYIFLKYIAKLEAVLRLARVKVRAWKIKDKNIIINKFKRGRYLPDSYIPKIRSPLIPKVISEEFLEITDQALQILERIKLDLEKNGIPGKRAAMKPSYERITEYIMSGQSQKVFFHQVNLETMLMEVDKLSLLLEKGDSKLDAILAASGAERT